MKKVVLIADRSRSDFAELRALTRRISELTANTEVEIVSSTDEIEQVAKWNISKLPVLVVDGEVLIILNPESTHVADVVKRIVA